MRLKCYQNKIDKSECLVGTFVKLANEPLWANNHWSRFIGKLGEITTNSDSIITVWYPELRIYWDWHHSHLTLYSNKE